MSPDYVPNFEDCLLPYVQFYQDDFLGGVRGMRSHHIGIYTMLLMEMYARGRALDLPEDRLARLCGSDLRTFRAVLKELIDDGKIIRLDCGLWNERCENAFRCRAKLQASQKKAGKRSAEKRNENNDPIQRTLNDRSTAVQPSSEAQNNTNTSVLGASAPPGVRTVLFGEGLQSLRRQTRLPDRRARTLIGKWLKAANEDAAKVLIKIRQAEADMIADPVAWIEKALQSQSEYDLIWARS